VPSPSQSTSTAVAACATSQLKITMTHPGGAAGEEGGYLRFANSSAAPCQLHGWPTVLAVTATGRTVKARHHGTSYGTWHYVPPLPVIRLSHGSAAYAVVAADDVAPYFGGRVHWCSYFRWLRVTPPGGTGGGTGHVTLSAHLLGRVYLPNCGNVVVTAIVPLHDLPH
jgi:hypothetical protein